MRTHEPTDDLRANVHGGETIQWVVRPSPGARFLSRGGASVIVAPILGALLGAGAWYAVGRFVGDASLAVALGAGVFVAAVALSLRSALATLLLDTTEYAATDERLVRYGGALGRSMESLPFEGIQDAQYAVGAVERAFGVGTVTVDTDRGYEAMSFRFVPDPSEFAREVTELAGRARDAGGSEEGTAAGGAYSPGEGIETRDPSDGLRENIYGGEEVQWVVRPRRSARLLNRLPGALAGAAVLGLFLGFVVFTAALAFGRGLPAAAVGVGAAFALAFLLVPGAVIAGYLYATVEYAATDRRLIEYREYLGRSMESLPLEGVQDAEYAISATERLYGVGTVTVDTGYGYETMSFPFVPNPAGFAREISRLAASGVADRPLDGGEGGRTDDFPTHEPTDGLRENVHGGEAIRWVVRPHKAARLARAVAGRFVGATLASVVIGGAVGVGVAVVTGERAAGALAALGAFLLVFLGTVAGPVARFLLARAEYALTDDRIVAYSGVFGRELDGVPLDGVQDAEYSMDAIGRLLDVGDVSVDTDHDYDTVPVDAVPNPPAVAREITRSARAAGAGTAGDEVAVAGPDGEGGSSAAPDGPGSPADPAQEEADPDPGSPADPAAEKDTDPDSG